MRKVGIIGLGNVGAMIAQMIVQAGYVDELVLIDKNTAKSKRKLLTCLMQLAYSIVIQRLL